MRSLALLLCVLVAGCVPASVNARFARDAAVVVRGADQQVQAAAKMVEAAPGPPPKVKSATSKAEAKENADTPPVKP